MITSVLGANVNVPSGIATGWATEQATALVAQWGTACAARRPLQMEVPENPYDPAFATLVAELERRCALEQGSTAWGWVKDRKWWFLGGGAAVVGGLVWWHSRR